MAHKDTFFIVFNFYLVKEYLSNFMIRKTILYSIFCISFFYLIINIVYESDNFDKINKSIPNYFQWKNLVKNIFFLHKKKNNILIKTDGLESFSLSKEDQIYIYSDYNKSLKLSVKGVLKNENILCLEKDFKKDFVINIKYFNPGCNDAIYFIGQVNSDFFYFAFQQSKKNSKNLLVLPTTNFFDYSGNKLNFDFHNTDIDYIAKLDEIPHSDKMKWALKTSQSIHNINKIVGDFNITVDYKFEKTPLENYDLIILPLHQEKVSEIFIEKLLQFLSNKNKIVLSIGGASYFREVNFKDNAIIFNRNNNVNTQKYNFPTWDYELNTNCYYEDNKNLKLGEITQPIEFDNTSYYFYKIICDNSEFESNFKKLAEWDPNKISNFISKSNNARLPLLGVTNFENNGKLLHLMTDGIGLNFSDISYLKLKVLEELSLEN